MGLAERMSRGAVSMKVPINHVGCSAEGQLSKTSQPGTEDLDMEGRRLSTKEHGLWDWTAFFSPGQSLGKAGHLCFSKQLGWEKGALGPDSEAESERFVIVLNSTWCSVLAEHQVQAQ